MDNALAEKQAVRDMVGDLMTQVHYDPKAISAEGDTQFQHIWVWKEGDSTFAKLRKVR